MPEELAPAFQTVPGRDVFISYASHDKAVADTVCKALENAALTCWIAPRDVVPGESFAGAIVHAIDATKAIVLVLSEHSADSQHVLREVERASSKRHPLIALRIDLAPMPADLEYFLNTSQWLDASTSGVKRALPKLVDAARSALALSASAASITSSPAATASATRPPARWLAVIAAITVAALGYVLVDKFWLSKRVAATVEQAALAVTATPTGAAVPEKSIAVLPFVDMSEKHDQEYFSDGLTEELLDMLSQVPDLRVPARTSSFYFKGRPEDIPTIAQKLRVAHVLEGSVRKAGNTIRVTAQLIRADNGYHLWSKTYDRDIKDIFKVQDEIAAAVVEALKAKLLPAQDISSHHRTTNIEAYTQYLLGNQLRALDTPEANRQALASYQKAIALDPGYAAAYSGLSETEWRMADQSTSEAAGYRRAAAAAEKAITLAPDSPDGYWARGQLQSDYFFNWNRAQSDYEHALALDPNYVRALIAEGRLFATLGRMPEAIATMRKAIALDPMSVVAQRALVSMLVDADELSAAREAANRLREINPQEDPYIYGDIELFSGRAREALAIYQTGSLDYKNVGIAMAEHTLGHAAESQRALEILEQKYANDWAYQIVEVYAWRGESDKAFEWLERAYRQRDGGLTSVTYDRALTSLRGDPRYKALLHKMNLPD